VVKDRDQGKNNYRRPWVDMWWRIKFI
jgi:hypothetical protein